jgi:uncharacterized protein DUF222/HNH endonuclease
MATDEGTPLSELEAAVRRFTARKNRRVDVKRLRVVIDALEGEFSAEVREVKASGDHLIGGNITAASWVGRACGMSTTAAADRLCVGEQLQSLPRLAAALSSGEIGFQSASVLCHLREQLGELRDLFNEEEMLEHARQRSVGELRILCRYAWHAADPEGFFNEAEADFSRRRLHISQMPDGLWLIDGVLDPVCGAALRKALESLARRLGPDDTRKHSQRMADSFGELVHHAMDEGNLPRRNGVRPHVTVTTTLEGLKNEVGAPPAEVELSLPLSTRTLERIACDSTVSRVLLADSMVVDVGRATRVVSAPTLRALRQRDRGCRWPGCDRQVNWSTPHHIVAWANGGPTHLNNLVLLCCFHHRLVHEGGWQVVKAGREFRFVPPERLVVKRARGPGMRWAA